MPTNTTTNTNTTPLSAMTGEEVASILVGLIRQNDGVLIQTELENAVHSTGYAAIANDMAQGKQALYTLLQSKGVTIQGNESISECCALLNAACLTLGECELASGHSWDIGKMLTPNAGDMFRVYKSNEQNIALIPNAVSIVLPNAINMSMPSGNILMNLYAPNMIFDVDLYAITFAARHLTGCLQSNKWNFYCPYLYDFIPTQSQYTANINFISWKPTDALNQSLQNLCPKDEWDDENQPTFANNLQKFLWYFEYHFIPCFGTVTTSPVLSLYTTVYNAINSANSITDPTKTLKQLLTDKGWEVASVS